MLTGTDQKMDKKTLDQLRQEKIAALGTKWVLHPANAPVRNGASVLKPRLGKLAKVRAAAVAAGRL